MQAQKSLSTQSLLILLVGNAVVIVQTFLLAVAMAPPLSFVTIGLAGLLVTLGMWVAIRNASRRVLERATGQTTLTGTSAPEPLERMPQPTAVEPPPAPEPEPAPPRLETPEQPPEAAAIQMLAILQREGRLVDFLQEDIAAYDDAQIGAAVRSVHEGCRAALREHVTLTPVMDRPEGSTVTVEPGFDAHAIRLTGTVAGDPPFTGTLQHRGWRVARLDLPALMQTQERVVAAAEVEVQ